MPPLPPQISASVLSADGEHDLDVTAINAASAALLCSDIPWGGPVAAVRVVLGANGELAINPPPEQQELAVEGGGEGGAVLRLLVATTTDRVVMLEAEVGSRGSGALYKFVRQLLITVDRIGDSCCF